MKMIILAAGQGTRLRPYTNEVPKCMVKYNNKPIIDYILDVTEKCDITDVAVINGYKKDVLTNYLETRNVKFYTNEKFDKTNMVSTLFEAEEFMDDDLIISYSDIIYEKEILQSLMDSQADVSVAVDKNWRKLWEMRLENPLDDAETLKIDTIGNLIELGKKPKDYSEVEAQYIGLIKISKDALPKVIAFYNNLDKSKNYDGKDFDNMYMTSFLQNIIDDLMPIKAVINEKQWIEIDSCDDLEIYEKNLIKF